MSNIVFPRFILILLCCTACQQQTAQPADSTQSSREVIFEGEPYPESEPNAACESSWFGPVTTAMGSIAGILIGQTAGSGTGQQVGRILGGAAGGIASNEVKQGLCE